MQIGLWNNKGLKVKNVINTYNVTRCRRSEYSKQMHFPA